MISGLLSSVQVGDASFHQFIEDRFMKGTISIYDKIPKIKIQTGLKKKITKSKPVQVLQEDVQGFGILAEQNISLAEAFRYPVTINYFGGNIQFKKWIKVYLPKPLSRNIRLY